MADRITECIHKRYIIISFVIMILLGVIMMGFVSPYLSDHANGYPYLETKLFYTPGDLFEMVDGYGEEGRALYVCFSLSLDLLVPLSAANLLTSFSLLLSKKTAYLKKWRKPLLALGIATCASDWIENLFMISLIKTYPQQYIWLAVMGRIMTSVKYLLMVAFIVVIVREVYLRRDRTVKGR